MGAFSPTEQEQFLAQLGLADGYDEPDQLDEPQTQAPAPTAPVQTPVETSKVTDIVFDASLIEGIDLSEEYDRAYRIYFDAHKKPRQLPDGSAWNKALHSHIQAFLKSRRPKPTGHVKVKVVESNERRNEAIAEAVLAQVMEALKGES